MLKKVLLDFDYYEDLLLSKKKLESLQKKSNFHEEDADKDGHGLIIPPKIPEQIVPVLPQETVTNIPVPSTSQTQSERRIFPPDENISALKLSHLLPKRAVPRAKKLLEKLEVLGIEVKNSGDVFVNGLLFSNDNGVDLIRQFVCPKQRNLPQNFEEFSKLLSSHGINRYQNNNKLRADKQKVSLPKTSGEKYWWWLGDL